MSIATHIQTAIDFAKSHPLLVLAATHTVTSAFYIWQISEGKPLNWVKKKLFQAALAVVPASVLDAEQENLRKTIESSVIGNSLDGEDIFSDLPDQGMDKDELVSLLKKYSQKDGEKWKSRQVSGTIYHGGTELTDVIVDAFKYFALSNPLHPDVFPLVRKMESEVVAMTVKLFNGGPDACGVMTSGGTESILMAMKSYREAGKKRGITEPELVVPVTAHAAFDKACEYFGIKLVHIPVDPVTFKADPGAIEHAINANTIGLVCSAPCYPQGVVDPVPTLGRLALKYNIPLHVDCCLGSYLIAFSKEAGYPQPNPFDFSVPGVTSISCDTHKYGFAPKGSSIVMYKDKSWRHYQYFVAPSWTGGIYASPSIAGSRPGALVAGCWATLMYVGRSGYIDAAKKIISTCKNVSSELPTIEGLCLYGEPTLSVVCFGPSKNSKVNIYHVNDAMSSRGWNLNMLQNPACIHICITYANADSVRERFIADLKDSVAEVLSSDPEKYKHGSVAIYGMAASIPDKTLVNFAAHSFLDALYKSSK